MGNNFFKFFLRGRQHAKVADLQSMKATCWNIESIVVSRVMTSTLDFQFVLQYVMKKRETEPFGGTLIK